MLRFSIYAPNINKNQHILWHLNSTFKAFARYKESEIRIYREGGISLEVGEYGKRRVHRIYMENIKDIEKYAKDDRTLKQIIEGKHPTYFMDIKQLPKWSVYHYKDRNDTNPLHLWELNSPY